MNDAGTTTTLRACVLARFSGAQMFTAYDMLEQARDTYKRLVEKVIYRLTARGVFPTPAQELLFFQTPRLRLLNNATL